LAASADPSDPNLRALGPRPMKKPNNHHKNASSSKLLMLVVIRCRLLVM
jgi:hypothetical protein